MRSLIFLLLLFLSQTTATLTFNTTTKQPPCLTGYRILVRHNSSTQSNQTTNTTYKLSYRCLCPNNYYGPECSIHLGMDCILAPTNKLEEINQSNIKESIEERLEFSVDCFVVDGRRDFFSNRKI